MARRIGLIQTLIINELVEAVMPVAYCVCILMAYYGPNADVLGNVKNSSWQYSAIEDLSIAMEWIAILFFVDFGSTIISIALLCIFCQINIFKLYLQLQKNVWYILAIQQAYLVEEVSTCY